MGQLQLPSSGWVSGQNKEPSSFGLRLRCSLNFRHSHLVSLIGYCNDHPEMIIVYEFMPGGTLADNLHKISGSNRRLSWIQRLKVCLGAARGLDYLHTGTDILTRVIHRDVKSSNILLDVNLEAKISDFGLSKVGPAEQLYTHVSTHVKGTFGYLDPEYFLTHRLTRKSDVYAFGVVMFEALCGRAVVDTRLDEEQWSLAKWVKRCIKEGKLHEIVDPHLNGSILLDCLKAFAQIAEQCLHNSSKNRPTMAEVVTRLEYALSLQEMTTFSLMDAEVISNGGVYDNHEGIGSSIETEVRDAGHGNFSTLNNNGNVGYNDKHTVIRSQSSIHAAKKVTFAKQVRLFFATKAPAKAPDFSALPGSPSALDWKTRKRIAVGSAKGLACLHEDYIIHHNIGAASVFLNEFSDVVIGNFGVAQHRYQNVADFTALVHGNGAYLAPEYLSTGMYSRETDVYGYGVMLLELITGPMSFDLSQRAIDDNARKLIWVRSFVRERKFQRRVDKNLQWVYIEKEVKRLTKVALLCTHGSPTKRPKMSEVVRMLQGDELATRWEV